MDAIKVLIVEDEWIVSEEIKEILIAKGFEVVGQAEDGQSALEMLKDKRAHVALLDINLKGKVDGIELAKQMVQYHQCAIIFLTAFDDEHYINRAKKVKPAAFIVKPYQERNLQMAIEIAFSNLIMSSSPPTSGSYFASDVVFLRDQHRFKKVSIDDIDFIQAVGSYIDIHADSVRYTLAINLKSFQKCLNNAGFMRIHRSYLVNLTKIDEYEGNQVFIKGTSIPISATHKEEFLAHFNFI